MTLARRLLAIRLIFSLVMPPAALALRQEPDRAGLEEGLSDTVSVTRSLYAKFATRVNPQRDSAVVIWGFRRGSRRKDQVLVRVQYIASPPDHQLRLAIDAPADVLAFDGSSWPERQVLATARPQAEPMNRKLKSPDANLILYDVMQGRVIARVSFDNVEGFKADLHFVVSRGAAYVDRESVFKLRNLKTAQPSMPPSAAGLEEAEPFDTFTKLQDTYGDLLRDQGLMDQVTALQGPGVEFWVTGLPEIPEVTKVTAYVQTKDPNEQLAWVEKIDKRLHPAAHETLRMFTRAYPATGHVLGHAVVIQESGAPLDPAPDASVAIVQVRSLEDIETLVPELVYWLAMQEMFADRLVTGIMRFAGPNGGDLYVVACE